MKRIGWILLCCFILTACKSEKTTVSLVDYNQFIEAIDKQIQFKENSDYFDVALSVNEVDGGYRYDLIIGNVKEPLSNVRVVCKDNGNADYYPSLGLYDNPITLDSYTDKQKEIYKGINLSGISEKNIVEVKILIEFFDQKNQPHQEYIKLSKGMEE